MKTIAQLKEQESRTQEEIKRIEIEKTKAHAQLVEASRDGKADNLGELANAEIILIARVEALQQIRAEQLAQIEQAEKEANSKEAQARAKAIKQLEAELEAAAREAGKQFVILEKIVNEAIDKKHTELVRMVNSDRNLAAREAWQITQGSKSFLYLYNLYMIMKREQNQRAVVADLERAAAR